MKVEKYLLDGKPISANDLIKEASFCDEEFEESFIKQTSVAAGILRDNGHIVDDNPDFDPTKS